MTEIPAIDPDVICEMCGEPIDTDMMYCLSCKESVGGQKRCGKCEGKGTYDELDKSKVTPVTVSPPYKTVDCDECDGKGWVDL